MHETRMPHRQGYRDPRSHESSLTRLQDDVCGGHEINAGITRLGVGRNRYLRVQPGQEDLHVRHGRRDYPEGVSESADDVGPVGNEPGSATPTAQTFRERLYVSFWAWPLPLLLAGILAAEVHMGYPGIRAWLPYLVLLPLTGALMIRLGWTKVEVADGELWVGDAHLPVRFIEDAEVIPARDKRRALGPELDPSAFLVHRGWIPGAVRVWLDDENDPTPYWVVSTRHPEKLVKALTTP